MLDLLIVMPAYRAEATLARTVSRLPVAAPVLVCDDASPDGTVAEARRLRLEVLVHPRNRGYGGNQKTLYAEALRRGAGVVVMVHPDDQYDTSALPEMVRLLRSGEADFVLGTRMHRALENGMPLYKYLCNRALSCLQNLVFGRRLSEYHSGFRGYRADLLREMPFESFSDDFVFDGEAIAWTVARGRRLAEVPSDCLYHPEASSIGFWRSVRYGLGTLRLLLRFRRSATRISTP